MPFVLVHGNPETEGVWNDLRPHLARPDVVALSPPGLGPPVADGFGATSDPILDARYCGCFDPEYVWPDIAQVWQTPEAGEAAVERMLAAHVARSEKFGMSPDIARHVVAATDAAMGRCNPGQKRLLARCTLGVPGSRWWYPCLVSMPRM